MARNTKTIILEAFDEMLEKTPLPKITVTEIAKRCNIGRNTFYYHYIDIYDLLDALLSEWIVKYEKVGEGEIWQDVLKALLYALKENRKKVYNIFNYLTLEQFLHIAFKRTNGGIATYVRSLSEGRNVDPEKLEVIIDVAEYTVYGNLIRFLKEGMKEDVDIGVNRLGTILDELLDNLLK